MTKKLSINNAYKDFFIKQVSNFRALYEVDLHTLPNRIAIPKGTYDAVFVLQGYDEEKNQLSDFFIHLPIVLNIEDDLTEELQAEYGITLAERIDN